MTMLSIGPVRRWCRFAGLFAILLVLASAMPVRAGVRPPLSSGGVVNNSFGTNGECSLASWTGTGSYATVQLEYGDCEATITAASRGSQQSTLEQRFLVDRVNPRLTMFIVPSSSNSGVDSKSAQQTVALFDRNGNLIYSKSRNTDLAVEYPDGSLVAYAFSYDLTSYSGDYVTIRITSSIDPTIPLNFASLRIDFDSPSAAANGGGPTTGNTGGW